MPEYDAVVVGSGPNGLAAAIELARGGCSVLVVEANRDIGGGVRSAELTLPGFIHDVCSTAMPMVPGSPFLSQLPLDDYGLELVCPDYPLAHPLDDGTAAVMHQDIGRTATGLGNDGEAYRALMGPLVEHLSDLATQLLKPLRIPRHPFLMARFGLNAVRSVSGLARSRFDTEAARALVAGIGAHSFLGMEQSPSAAFALVLGMFGHGHNWPFVRGGSGNLAGAMAGYLRSLGGEIQTGWRVRSLNELPDSRVTMLDLTPMQVLEIAGDRFHALYRRQLQSYRYGPGVFKMDWALDSPVPWISDEVSRAGTVHLGSTLQEISISEGLVKRGLHPERPFVLLTQPSLFDDTRAPEGKHTLWAYCHVPNGSMLDMSERIEQQIERFAPGFRERVLQRSVRFTSDLEATNPNCIGGDINGGIQDLGQLFTRPAVRWSPYRTPAGGLYLCSASTPPGGGVHGMAGYHAARAALADL